MTIEQLKSHVGRTVRLGVQVRTGHRGPSIPPGVRWSVDRVEDGPYASITLSTDYFAERYVITMQEYLFSNVMSERDWRRGD